VRIRPAAVLAAGVAVLATAAGAVGVPAASSGAPVSASGATPRTGEPSAAAAARTGPGAAADTRATSCPAVPGARALPTADAVLGRGLTDRPPTAAEADRYLLALDAASPRIVTGVAGRSVRGLPLRYALAGDPGDLSPARLRAISAAVRAVRRGDTDARSVTRAASGPAIVWIGGGVHANEPSGVTAALALLRRLGTDDGCATRRSLDGTLAVVVPDQNPEGREPGTRTNAADIDLNRDWAAASQPETAARLGLLERFPPAIALDVHEQAGDGYFVPPYADPVVRGLPAAIRRVADGPVSRAIGRALEGIGTTTTHRGYDLLYPGYADSATSLLFGSGGMTLEQGSDPSLAEKSRRHETAMLAALGAVAADRPAVVRAWAAGFAAAERDGRAGRGTTGDRVFGWTLRTDRHGADALALAERLRSRGVRVRQLRRSTRLTVDPLGPAPAGPTVLPAGTLVVPAAQPLSRWTDVLLGRDADEAGADSSGADTWSAPRAAGVDAGVLRAAVPGSALGPVTRPATAPGGATVTFDGDSAAAARLALRALADGRPVARTASGALRTVATADWLRVARTTHVAVRRSPATGGDVALRLPSIATPADPTPLLTGPPATLPALDRPAGWIGGALRAAGVAPVALAPASLDVGLPAGTTHLVLGPGALPDDPPSAGARSVVQRFVRGGGTVVALGAAGTEAAVRLGVSSVRTDPGSGRAAFAVRAVPGTDRAGSALGGPTSVIVFGEPLLVAPAGAAVPLRAASGSALAPSGARGAGAGLGGRPLVVDEALGSGHVLTLGFSPAFRRQSAGGEHVLLSLLLPGS